ncbi:MAG: hypothetical protein LBN02_01780 [Oscillospiraceae bacterium]|jgi:hypothetical protein|nr:hypothetical protein [Oscillospiraceae bacterium]
MTARTEPEQYLGFRLDANLQQSICEMDGIHGLEYRTNGNARYTGTHDLSYVTVDDYNEFVRQITT